MYIEEYIRRGRSRKEERDGEREEENDGERQVGGEEGSKGERMRG